jgi:hypothetical protein
METPISRVIEHQRKALDFMLDALGLPYEAMPCDPDFADTAAFCERYGIAPEDVPNPFNLNQHMIIDCKTGRMEHTTVRAKPGSYVDLRAEMDLLVALSACPDMPVGGQPADLVIYEP